MKLKNATLIALIGTVLYFIESLINLIRFGIILGTSFNYVRCSIEVLFSLGLTIFFILLYSKQIKEDTETINQSLIPSSNTSERQNSSSAFSEYMSFKRMISLTIVPIIYVIGTIAIVVMSSVLIYRGIVDEGAEHLILEGFGFLTIGNVLWRLVCEGWASLICVVTLSFNSEKKCE